MLFYLTEANLYRDAKRVEKVVELLNTIYSAYREIILERPTAAIEAEEAAKKAGSEAMKSLGISL
jgi:flagellin-specific chaperone FliS